METIKINKSETHWTISLNRPEIHNALNETVMTELKEAFDQAGLAQDCRAIVLAGEGKSFCAGADLNYMKSVSGFTQDQHQAASHVLHQMFYSIYSNPKPVIARVHGAAVGGGLGLVAACDFAFGVPDLRFSFSEVRLGLVPAVISPFVMRKIGESRARKLFLTGVIFTSEQALSWDLLDSMSSLEQLDDMIMALIGHLNLGSPSSHAKIKNMMDAISNQSLEAASQITTQAIAEARVSPEGQEGMAAYLEKRKAKWVP